MFNIRDLMIHTVPSAAGAQVGAGRIICYWPSLDCCGAFWSNPGGGGPGNIGTTRWLTQDFQVAECAFGSLRPGGCGLNYSTCPDGSVFTLRAHLANVVNPAELKLLRGELDAAVELAKQRQVDLEKQSTPSSLDEVKTLEAQLKSALEEVQARKKELGGK